MKIISLTTDEFDSFALNHMYRNIYQTSSYGKFLAKQGSDVQYIGFTNNNDELVGASLFITYEIVLKQKSAYFPYGFLIDYSNIDFLRELSSKLKDFLIKNNYVYYKIDPLIHCSKRDAKGNITSYNPEINSIIDNLQKCGFKHRGFNKFFENKKCRFNAMIRLTSSNERLYNDLESDTKEKIEYSDKLGSISTIGSIDDLEKIVPFFKNNKFTPEHDLKYYHDLLESYGENAEIHIVKIDPYKYVKNSKEMYEHELEQNEKYASFIQENNFNGTDLSDIINKKMESDKVLGDFQAHLTRSTSLVQSNPDGIVIGGIILIKQDNMINIVEEGFDSNYNEWNPCTYLKWELIKKFNTDGFQYFNLGDVVGEFIEQNDYSELNDSKLCFNPFVVEFAGEFDFIVNEIMYNLSVKDLIKK